MAVLHLVCGRSRKDRKYNCGFRTDTGQFAAGKKRDRSLVFSADCAQKRCRAGSPGLASKSTHPSAFWPHHAPLCPALSFQRVHQQLPLLRVLPENPILRVTLSVDEVVKEARHLEAAGFRNSFSSPANIQNSLVAIILPNVSALCVTIFLHLDRGRSDGNRRLSSGGRGWRGRSRCLPGNVRPRHLPQLHLAGPKRILPGAWHVPSVATTPVFVALELARFLAWPRGVRKRSRSRPISNICSNVAGNLPSP